MEIARTLPGRKTICSPQCGLKSFAVEADDPADQAAERGVRSRPDRQEHGAKKAGRSCVRSVSRVTTPRLPPPPPFSAQNRSGLVHALTVLTARRQ